MNMLQYIFSKKSILFIIVIFSVQLFTLIIFPRSTLALIEMVGTALLLLLFIIYQIYTDKSVVPIKPTFKLEVNLLLAGVLLSVPMASVYHHQNPATTFFAQKYTYYFLLYYYMHYTGVSAKNLEKLIFGLGVVWCILFLIQYKIYPNIILNARVHLDRGTIRIFFPGNTIALIAFFLSLHKILTEKFKLQYLIYILFFLVISGVLQGSRSNLGSLMILVALFIGFYKNVKSRLFIIALSIVVIIGAFFLFSGVIDEMVNVSEKQVDNSEYEDPIRLQAFRFFMSDFQPSKLTYLLGNGADHGSSPYGQKIIYYKLEHNFYQSDIGIAGEFTKFGLLFFIAEIMILIGGTFGRHPKGVGYLKYVFAYILMTGILGAGPLSSSSQITSIMMMLYLIDVYRSKEENAKKISSA